MTAKRLSTNNLKESTLISNLKTITFINKKGYRTISFTVYITPVSTCFISIKKLKQSKYEQRETNGIFGNQPGR